ncbi:MAG: hypothetical protein LBO67_04785 [Spirochaetaceae bacterium]|jgi:hypothetical protein|nr:hypothetical protein [Spirochaetaceae bacterium]
MAVKQYKYTAKIKQPQIIAGVRIDPKGGTFNEKQVWAIKHDVYGRELVEKGFLIFDEKAETQPVKAAARQSAQSSAEADIQKK